MNSQPVYYLLSYFITSLALALMLVPLMRDLAFRVGAVDVGSDRRIHTGLMPRLGGPAIYVSVSVPIVFSLTRGQWDTFHSDMIGVLVSSAIVFLLGVYDDIKDARIRMKLAVEVLAAVIAYAMGVRITSVSNPFNGTLHLGWMALPVTVLWLIVIANSFNLIDGLDGLASGTGIFIAAILFALPGNDLHQKLVLAVLAGGLAGFLRYNYPPASIFMGDSGSLFIGFFLGALSIVLSKKATAMATLMVPILAFGLPIIDMAYAVLRRYYRGLPLGMADREHIHHKLLDTGLSKSRVVNLLYLINILIMLFILFFVRRQLNTDFFGLVFLTVLMIAGLRMLGYVKFIPFFKEILRSYTANQRRKFFSYVIRNFKKNLSLSRDMAGLRTNLDSLMNEYRFSSARIDVRMPGIVDPVYTFGDDSEKACRFLMTVPVRNIQGDEIGTITLKKGLDEDIYCTSELIEALSHEVGSFVSKIPLAQLFPPRGEIEKSIPR